MRRLTAFFSLLVLCLFASQAFAAAKITIINNNAPGVGFNDPTPATPVGGNTGTTLGEQRMNAFKESARLWAQTLDSPVEIRILASLEPLSCTPTSGVLGSTGILYIWSDFGSDTVGVFPGPEFSQTWYGSALANKRAGRDLKALDPTIDGSPSAPFADMRVRFNSQLGTAACLTGQAWYYGYDLNAPAGSLSLVTVMLHEYSHGFNFSQFASVTSGAMPRVDPSNPATAQPDIYNRNLYDNTTHKTWPEMTNAERAASAVNPRQVAWIGPTVTAAVPSVLAHGVPTLRVNAPSGIAGAYEVGQAAFGPALTSTMLTGDVVIANDAADAAGPSTNDACSPITNDLTGKIAFVTRGTCGFIVKVKNAQNAGAIAVLVADNAPGFPPSGLGGADPTITIPSVRISITDGSAIRTQLLNGATVNASLGIDLSRVAGADSTGHALMYTPNPVAPGSTISHYDDSAFPNQLMEFAINSDLTHEVSPPKDLTLPLLRDIGWFPDADNDGVADASDQCAGSDTTPGPIYIGSCNTTVPNPTSTSGCNVRDLLANATKLSPKGQYLSNVAHLGDSLIAAGIINSAQKDALVSCAATKK